MMCLLRSVLKISNRGNVNLSSLNIRYCAMSSNSQSRMSNKGNSDDNKGDQLKIPEAPTNCCMSGCSNCVWIEYAETLTEIFKDSGEKSQELILSKVDDENMKAFLKMELRLLRKRLEQKNKDDSKH